MTEGYLFGLIDLIYAYFSVNRREDSRISGSGSTSFVPIYWPYIRIIRLS